VEGLHAVGYILTKISVNYVINLHVALSFTCSILWVIMCMIYNCVYIYGYCPHMMHVYVYCYFRMNPCIYKCISMFTFYIYVFARAMCVYILIACNSKNLSGIAQSDVGYVTLCSTERTKVFSGVAWPGLGIWGCYNMVSELQFQH
jgi:hypothetical protein